MTVIVTVLLDSKQWTDSDEWV